MSIEFVTVRRVAALALMLAGLVLLADGAVRVELADAVSATLPAGPGE